VVGLTVFEERDLSPEVAGVRDDHAPDAVVYDAETDFETLPAAALEDLLERVELDDPISYPFEWLPDDAPDVLARLAGPDLVIGTPGDGSVAWTRQTDPPAVIVKARVRGSPESFVDFLLAEAFVQIGSDQPEHFLGFFEERYRDLDDAVPLSAADTYQVANALYDGYLGLHTRDTFADWGDEYPDLAAAWHDAGDRLEPRLSDLPREVSLGGTSFADATELACAALKHAVEVPAPFAALDTLAYRDHGPAFAVRWAEKTFDQLA
jgi:hypothetical protein